MKLISNRSFKIMGTFFLSFLIFLQPAHGLSLFSRKTKCIRVHERNAFELVLDLNGQNHNFLNLPDYSEGTYLLLNSDHQKKFKSLKAHLNSLNLRRKYTENQKADWALGAVEKIGEIVSENSHLRKRAQAELLKNGLNDFLSSNPSSDGWSSESLFLSRRLFENLFDNFVTRWAGVPLVLPNLRYKELGPDLLKKILFEGYDQNEEAVMKALKETNRIAAYNRFSRSYSKFIFLAALAVVPAYSYFSIEKSMEQNSQAVIVQVQEAQVQSATLRDVDWRAMENSLVLIHAKADLEAQLNRPLTHQETSDLQEYIRQNSKKSP